jgi:hypothetical protein
MPALYNNRVWKTWHNRYWKHVKEGTRCELPRALINDIVQWHHNESLRWQVLTNASLFAISTACAVLTFQAHDLGLVEEPGLDFQRGARMIENEALNLSRSLAAYDAAGTADLKSFLADQVYDKAVRYHDRFSTDCLCGE